jgi:hypothetical protein
MEYLFVLVLAIFVVQTIVEVKIMSTTNTGLAALQAAVTALTTATNKLIADVQKLLAGQQTGPGAGQVIVNQSDIDALTSSVTALTGAEQAADATVNPPTPPSA